MTLDDYLVSNPGASTWRRKAFSAITRVLEPLVNGADPVLDDPAALLEHVDAAYPFGERKHHPYKAWLAERARLRAVIEQLTLPTADEIAACEVARDAILDEVGDDVVQRLLAQAPNRHARKCAVCGARPGKPCTELVPAEPPTIREGNPYDNVNRALASQSHRRRPLVVPHQARLLGHGNAGPLFGGR